MKIIATLLIRDEEDLVEKNIKHHLEQGVNGFFVTLHKSTKAIKDRLAKIPEILDIVETDETGFNQWKWVTTMARKAYYKRPDWIVHLDVDEFWCNLKNLKGKSDAVLYLDNSVKRYHPVDYLIPELNKEFKFSLMPFYETKQGGVRLVHKPCENIFVSQGNHKVFDIKGNQSKLKPWEVYLKHYSNRGYESFKKKIEHAKVECKKTIGHRTEGVLWQKCVYKLAKGTLEDFYMNNLIWKKENLQEKIKAGKVFVDDFLV